RIAAAAAGLFVRATADAAAVAPGDKLTVAVELVARTAARLGAVSVALPGAKPAAAAPFAQGDKQQLKLAVELPADAPISVPYRLVAAPEPGRYRVRDPALVGAPRTPPALVAAVDLTVEGAVFHVEAPVLHAWTDNVKGERTRELQVLPPATVT